MTNPSASLYVGDLTPEVTEGMLFETFNAVGPVASIRVCRDTLTRRSLGYAYVNFHNVIDAERALDTLNNTQIKGRPCRIMWSQRDPTIRRSGIGNIFIKNLDPSIGHKELYDTFSAFGNILSCKVAMDEKGNSKGFGFVHFENADSAENAIKTVHNMLLETKLVYVGKFVPKKERLRQKESSWTNVYVKDLDPDVSGEDLRAKFSEFGNVNSCVVSLDENGVSRQFGFVNFDRHEDAVKAVENLHETQLKGKKIWCGPAQKKSEREEELRKKFKQLKLQHMTKYQGTNLYVKNLEDEIDEERFKKEFSAFGNIYSAKIMTDEKGNSRGFGFVCYNTPEEAQRAITEMNSRILQSCSKPLYVALHEPKEIRRQKLAQRHAAARSAKVMRPGVGVGQGPVQMYGPGQVYYPQSGNVPPSGFVPYPPQQMIPSRTRGPWPTPQTSQSYQPYQPPLSYSVVIPQRGRGSRGGSSNNGSGGRGGGQSGGGGRLGRRNQNQGSSIPEQAQISELTISQLAQYSPEHQKLLIGERLWPLIHNVQPNLAGKITGMLLDSGWSIEELFGLIGDDDRLATKIEEAVQVLQRAQQQEGVETDQAEVETGDL
jgi:polyadenylate-binding protein